MNSFIIIQQLGENLKLSANDEFGNIEAIEHKNIRYLSNVAPKKNQL